MSVSIKVFDSQCQAGLVGLISEIQEGEFQMPVSTGQHQQLNHIPTIFQRDNGNYWVAVIGNRVIGSIAVLDIGHGHLALRDVFVHKDYRGQERGVSKQLLETVFKWAREHQVERIYLGSAPDFHAAHRFYEKYRFTEIRKEELPGHFPLMDVDTKFYMYEFV